MAARKRSAGAKKKSRAKSGGSKTASARGGSKKRAAAKKGAKKSAAKRGNRPAIKRSMAKKGSAAKKGGTAKKSSAGKKAGAKKSTRRSPLARVTRVAKEVAQQATTVVTESVETLKELGENIVDRVTS